MISFIGGTNSSGTIKSIVEKVAFNDISSFFIWNSNCWLSNQFPIKRFTYIFKFKLTTFIMLYRHLKKHINVRSSGKIPFFVPSTKSRKFQVDPIKNFRFNKNEKKNFFFFWLTWIYACSSHTFILIRFHGIFYLLDRHFLKEKIFVV